MMDKISDQWQTPQDLFDVLDKGGVYQGIEFNGFHFDIDLCATKENSKCDNYYIDYLNDKVMVKSDMQDKWYFEEDLGVFEGAKCFMNPPYSNPKPFIEKAWQDSKHCKIVCLVKCDPSTKWWATFWEYKSEQTVDMVKCSKCNGCGRYTWWQGVIGYEEDPCDVCSGDKVRAKRITVLPGPKPGCEVRFFPKRIQFDPPQQLIDSGEVWKIGSEWVKQCEDCSGYGTISSYVTPEKPYDCLKCSNKGYKVLPGPAFPSALIIMDRRGL